MKQVVHILACLLVALGLQPFGDAWGQGGPVLDGANAFITRWKGEAGKPIQVPLYGNYAYSWEKADGTVIKADVADVANEGVLELPVSKDGEYVLKAGPAGVKRIEYGINEVTYYLGRRGTPKSLLQVVQWGSVAWESFAGAFYGCEKMNIAEGAGRPDLSRVINMQSAFWDCLSFNSPIGNWDVSKVTNMAFMFVGCSSFNQPLGKWDVSNVTDMSRMFKDCRAFNQPLGQWNVSKVTNMFAMFSRCSSFNQSLEKWDVSKVTNMAYMFLDCSSFNQPLGNWDVSKVINMYAMFSGCSSFDQPLGQWTLSGLARDQSESHDLIVSSGLSVENYSATLAGWAAKKDQLTTGIRVKANARYFDERGKAARQELIEAKEWEFLGDEQWLPIEPLDSEHAFVTRWQGKAGDTISVPLYGQYSYEWLGADGRVVSSGEARVVKAGVLDLRVPADGEYVLRAGPAGVTQIEFGKYRWGLYLSSRGTPNALKEVSQWGGVKWESFAGAFYECTNMNIAEGAGKPDLSRVTNMESAFWDCLSLNSPIGNWDVSKVTNMAFMFVGCSSFNQPLERWDVSNVTDMSGMFAGCGLFNQPLGGWVFSAPEHHDRMNRLGLSNSGMSVHNYSSTLVEWAAKINRMPRRWHVDAEGLKYNAAAKAARKKLVEERQWEFSGDEEATW